VKIGPAAEVGRISLEGKAATPDQAADLARRRIVEPERFLVRLDVERP
jgi:hypothetical protein